MSVSTHIYSYPEAGVALKLDIYFGPPSQVPRYPVPAVVFFHGGSLLAGNREFFCRDIKRDALSRGWAFISSDYRLLIPSTGHEILIDVKSLFSFLACNLNKELGTLGCPHRIDPHKLFVGGSSAGAYPALLAALFAQPKPKGFFSLYGVGGDLLSGSYLPKLRSIRNEEVKYSHGTAIIPEDRRSISDSDGDQDVVSVEAIIHDNPDLRKFLSPTPEEKPKMRPVADVPFSWAPMVIISGGVLRTASSSSSSSLSSSTSSNSSTLSSSTPTNMSKGIPVRGGASNSEGPSDIIPGTMIPGHRARTSGKLNAALHISGTYLDYLTGINGLSDLLSMRQSYAERFELVKSIEKAKYLFPQLWIDKNFPPSILVHGDVDSVVNICETRRMVERLAEAGVEHAFLLAEGKGHQFEERAPPDVYVKYIKPVVEFLRKFA